jgi:hypothetical protein
MKPLSSLALFILLILAFPAGVQGQDCPIVVEEALVSAASCTSMGANEVCYGHGQIEALVNCENAPEFNSPGDVLPLNTLCTLRSSGMNAAGDWGLAVMQVQPYASTNVVTMIVIGEAQMQNAASSLSLVEVQANTDLDIYSGPGSDFPVLAEISAGEILQTNACNCTRYWLRTVLEDGQIGWLPAGQVTVIGDANVLPVATVNTPIYEPMQAFTLQSVQQTRLCDEAPEDGVLIQTPDNAGAVPLKVNNVPMLVNGSVFVQSQPGGQQTIEVLAGEAQVTVDELTGIVPEGMRAMIPIDENTPDGAMLVAPFAPEDVAALPLELLPEAFDAASGLEDNAPHIIGLEPCRVVSNAGETVCPVYFANRDGDAIVQMDVEFVSAPEGEWTGSTEVMPSLVEGDNVSGALSWGATCSLGRGGNFIGPVTWSITLTDEAGNISNPFEASFNCVDG